VFLKTGSNLAYVTSLGRPSHTFTPATGKAWPPTVKKSVPHFWYDKTRIRGLHCRYFCSIGHFYDESKSASSSNCALKNRWKLVEWKLCMGQKLFMHPTNSIKTLKGTQNTNSYHGYQSNNLLPKQPQDKNGPGEVKMAPRLFSNDTSSFNNSVYHVYACNIQGGPRKVKPTTILLVTF